MIRYLFCASAALTLGTSLVAGGASGGRSEAAVLPDALAVADNDPPAAFASCRACHTVARGGSAGVGPNLFGIVGSPAGARAGYSYSPAMRNAELRWSRATLDRFLANPRQAVPGTKMGVPGISDAARRRAIIDYLATLR